MERVKYDLYQLHSAQPIHVDLFTCAKLFSLAAGVTEIRNPCKWTKWFTPAANAKANSFSRQYKWTREWIYVFICCWSSSREKSVAHATSLKQCFRWADSSNLTTLYTWYDVYCANGVANARMVGRKCTDGRSHMQLVSSSVFKWCIN